MFLNLPGKFGGAGLDNLSVDEHMDEIGTDVVEQTLVVGDDDGRSLRGAELVEALCYNAEGIDIEARIGLVEDEERGFEHRHLIDLVALTFAS